MKDHPKWAVRLRWWLWDDSPDWFNEVPLLRLLCALFGHVPERDMCGLPAHDYCVLCIKSMPGMGAANPFPKMRLFRWLP